MAMTFRSLLRQVLPCCSGERDLEKKLSQFSFSERIERINKKRVLIEKAAEKSGKDINNKAYLKLEAEIESLNGMFIRQLLNNSAEELVSWANEWHKNEARRSHSESDLNKVQQGLEQNNQTRSPKIQRVNSVPKNMGSDRMKQASTEQKSKTKCSKGLSVWKRLSSKFSKTKPSANIETNKTQFPNERDSIFYTPFDTGAYENPYLCPESDIIDLPEIDDNNECENDLKAKHGSVTKEILASRKNTFSIRIFSQEQYEAACEAVRRSKPCGSLSGSFEDLTEDDSNLDWTKVFTV